MLKAKYDENAFQSYIDEYNPFAVKDEKGRFMHFVSYVDAYKDMLYRLFKMFPGKYIDMVLFLIDEYKFTEAEAVDEIKIWERRGFENPQLIDWFEPLYIHELRDIMVRLHGFTETSFKDDQFKLAYSGFSNEIKMFNKKEE